ncbi:MAG: YdcF family protein [Geminicoccaceae bacterium]
MFELSKIFWFLFNPGNLLALSLLFAVFFWRWWGARLLVSAWAVVLIGTAVLPVGNLVVRPLEDRFATMALPDHVDGIIVLGGSVFPDISDARGQAALNDNAERLVWLGHLGRTFPDARLVFTGGNGTLDGGRTSEGEIVRRHLSELTGLPSERVTIEDRSRNTYENATLTKDLVAPEPNEVWLLVTSAVHMPRSVGCFLSAGWRIHPYQVDYTTGAEFGINSIIDVSLSLGQLSSGLREYIGLVAYHLMDRTPVWWPGPEDLMIAASDDQMPRDGQS